MKADRTGSRLLAAAFCLFAVAASGEEILTIRAASAFPQGYRFSAPLEEFIEEVNRRGGGLLQIRYLGGGSKVVNPYELGQYVRKGIVGLALLPGAYYNNVLPEADAQKLCHKSMPELRENGGWEFINGIHEERMNVRYLGKVLDYIPFHLYMNTPPPGLDLSGLRLRVTPVYRDFFEYMGASTLRSTPSEIFTLLERGVVDGLGWPLIGLRDFGFESVVKYRVDPGFYRADAQILMNLDLWQSLDAAQRELLQETALRVEAKAIRYVEQSEVEYRTQREAGIEAFTMQGEEAEAWLEAAYEAAWQELLVRRPETASRLREYCAK